jgi:hypothetical protein
VLLAEFHPALAIETAMLAAAILALLHLRLVRKTQRVRLVAVGAAGALVVTAALLVTRSFHYGPDRSPRELGNLCGYLIENGYAVESTKTYPPVTWYAKEDIPEEIEPDRVLLKLYDKAPYFYLTRDKFLDVIDDDLPWEEMKAAGPIRYRDLILLTNPAGKAVLDEMRASSAAQ